MTGVAFGILAALTPTQVVRSEHVSRPIGSLDAVRTIIQAVNAKDADLYVSVFHTQAIVRLHGGAVRVRGRNALKRNRASHFSRFPKARSEIQHLIEIGGRVVMHDRVWLQADSKPTDVVEIFTFRDGVIVEVEVIQPDGVLPREEPLP